MVKYQVQITHECTASAEVVVEAESIKEAEQKAVQRDVWENAKWEMNDNYIDEVYCGDPGHCAEALPEEPEEQAYTVTIPYFHVFNVRAKNREEALAKAHEEGNGHINGYDDNDAIVENADFEEVS